MQFRQGMLGIAVVAVAIAAALMGSWIMSMDVEEREIINYDPLSDITGLFDTEVAPQFTDYSPSSNYTGYWTAATVIDDDRYFGGVDYTPANRPNNYRVDLPPTHNESGTLQLPVSGSVDVSRLQLQRWISDAQYANWSTDVEAYSLEDLLQEINADTTGVFKLASNEGRDALTNVAGPINVDWILFGSIESAQYADNYFFATDEFYRNNPSMDNQYHNHIALSMSADLDRNVVTLYSDNAFQNPIKVIAISDCVIFAGGQAATGDHELCLGSTGAYSYSIFPPTSYIDPSKGVEME